MTDSPRRTGLRFIMVGGFNTVFGYGVFAALELTVGDSVPYLAVLFAAYAVSIFLAFLLYRSFVFRVRGQFLPDLLRFCSVNLVAVALNAVLLPIAVDVFGLPVLPAQALVLAMTAILSYLVHGRWTFRRAGTPGGPS